jgi:DICT domain-containing protein
MAFYAAQSVAQEWQLEMAVQRYAAGALDHVLVLSPPKAMQARTVHRPVHSE